MSAKANNDWDIDELSKLTNQVRLGVRLERNQSAATQKLFVNGP